MTKNVPASLTGILLALVIGVYLLLVGMAGLALYWRSLKPTGLGAAQTVVAAAALPAGHMLVASDLKVLGLSGYVKAAIPKDHVVGPDALTAAPALAAPEGSILAMLAVDRARVTAGELNTATKVDLCQDKKSVLQATVQAVICQPGAGACAAAIPIAADKAALLKTPTIVRPSAIGCEALGP